MTLLLNLTKAIASILGNRVHVILISDMVRFMASEALVADGALSNAPDDLAFFICCYAICKTKLLDIIWQIDILFT